MGDPACPPVGASCGGAGATDLKATALRSAIDGAEIWSDREMNGTTRNGRPVDIVGPVILAADESSIARARFYLDPVAPSVAATRPVGR